MSKRVGNTVVIAVEPDMICFECGKVAETRPYGPNGEEICFQCGNKNPVETRKQMLIRLFGDSPEEADIYAKQMMDMESRFISGTKVSQSECDQNEQL